MHAGASLCAALPDLWAVGWGGGGGLAGEGGTVVMCGAARTSLVSAMRVNPEQDVLRLSFVHYMTQEEVGELSEALGEVL